MVSPTMHRLLAWLVLIAGMLISRGGYLENIVYNIDEAEYAVVADALKLGWLPGVDLLGTTKPPAISAFYFTLFETCGRSMAVLHVAHLILVVLTGAVFVELTIGLWGITAALPSAVLFWMTFNSFSLPSEILALNVESPGIFLALIALWLAWIKPRSWLVLFAAGAALGGAALFRQSFIVFLLPLAAAIWSGGEQRRRNLAASAIGFALPWSFVLGGYAARGALNWAWDSWVRYPFVYASDTGFAGFLAGLYYNASEFTAQVFIPLALALFGIVLLRRRRAAREFYFVAALALASLAALCSGSRFFGHYWIQTFPVLALLGVVAWLHLLRGDWRHRTALAGAIAIGAIIAALHFPLWRMWDNAAPPPGVSEYRLGEEQLELAIADFARANTTAGETIVVWGYCPQIYYHARRLPGVRDFLCHYITGYSPGSFDPHIEQAVRPYGHPQAEHMFIEDIERRRPKYIFDLVQTGDYYFPFAMYSIRQYPDLAEYLRLNYLPDGAIGSVPVYRRRAPQDTWWPSHEDIQ